MISLEHQSLPRPKRKRGRARSDYPLGAFAGVVIPRQFVCSLAAVPGGFVSKAAASRVNFSDLASGIAPSQIATIYATASGTNTYTATLSPAITAYASGMVVAIKFANANTGASTINLNSLGAQTIQLNGSAVTSGQIAAGATLELLYDGTNFQIVGNPSGGGGTVTSVGLSLPGIFSVSGSPVTTSGTLTAALANQSANLVFAGPASGSAAAPTFRTLQPADATKAISYAGLWLS